MLAARAPRAWRARPSTSPADEDDSLNELLDELGELVGAEVEAIYAEARPGDVPHSLADISRAREALGYEPGDRLSAAGWSVRSIHYQGQHQATR